jgi:hypothetical protein
MTIVGHVPYAATFTMGANAAAIRTINPHSARTRALKCFIEDLRCQVAFAKEVARAFYRNSKLPDRWERDYMAKMRSSQELFVVASFLASTFSYAPFLPKMI